MAGIVLFLCLFYAVLKSPVVQTRLVRYFTERIERATGAKIQIGGVNFVPIKSLVLEDVLLMDYRNDTLMYCQDFVMKIDAFHLFHKRFGINEVVFDNAYFNLWIERGEEEAIMNIEVFMAALQKNSEKEAPVATDKAAGQAWMVDLKKISVRNSRFAYREDEYEPLDYGINWTEVECSELNLDVTDFDFSGGKFAMRISDMCLLEKSGFRISELDAFVTCQGSNLLLTGGKIRTEKSLVNLDTMEYNWVPDQHDWRNFTTKMHQLYKLSDSHVSFEDLAYFNEKLLGIENVIACSGVVSNTVNQIEGRDLHLRLGEKSVLNGHFKSRGLPNFWNTIFDIEFYDTHLNPEDLETVYLPWLSQHISIPAPLHKLEHIDVEGSLTGKIEDFILKGRTTTPQLAGNFTFVYKPCDIVATDCSSLSGDFILNRVDCAKLMGNNWLGNAAISGRYNGQLANGSWNMNMVGKLNSLKVAQTRIRDVNYFFTYDKGKCNLVSSVDNDSLSMDVAMSYDTGDSLSFVSMKGNINARLDKLGMTYLGPEEKVGCGFDLIYVEDRHNNSFSNLSISGFNYTNASGGFVIHDLTVENSLSKGYYTTTLNSDIADMSIRGHFNELRPVDLANSLIRSYLPAYRMKKQEMALTKQQREEADFFYEIEMKDINRVLKVVYPDLRIEGKMRITADYRTNDDKIELSMEADTICYQDWALFKSAVNFRGNEESMNIVYQAEKAGYRNDYNLYNVRNEVTLHDNQVDNRLTWCNWEHSTYSGLLAAHIKFVADDNNNYRTRVTIDPGVIVMADNVWKISASEIDIDGRTMAIDNFRIGRGEQYFSLNGRISENPRDSLSLNLKQFNLSELNKIMFNNHINIFGIIDGDIILQDYYKKRFCYSDITVDHWGVNRDTLGVLRLKSYWDPEKEHMSINAVNSVGNEVPFRVRGHYAPVSDSIDIDIRLSKVGLERLGTYMPEQFSTSTGDISGRLTISGKSDKPDIAGLLYFDSVRITPRLLNTSLFINDSLFIRKNRLVLRDFTIRDMAGRTVKCNGFYKLREDKYDVQLRMNNFLLMNTDASQSESMYGRLHVSGLVSANNMAGIHNVTVNMRTDYNSRLFVPLTSVATETSDNCLHFVNTGQKTLKKTDVASNTRGISLTANLELNDNLEVQLVFDPTIGDVLRTTGAGDIKLTMDKDGQLSMFGEYKITKGDYLFTMSNLLNKKFILTPGGNIVWNGSPYNATVNLMANYNLKTSLNELMSGLEVEASARSTKVPVECMLTLSDNIVNPLVKFDINFPTLDTQTKSYVQGLFSSQDEINKQVFALLIMNKFYTPDYMKLDDTGPGLGAQAGTAGVTTVTEMMSSQLSRWLSQISNNFDIGFSYRRGDEITTDEIELALSTQILNDRVTLSANGNMDVGTTKNSGVNTPDGKNSMSNNIAGDFDVDVKLNRQGTLKLKAYSHTDEKVLYTGTETIQGIGVSYQETFDNLRELVRKYLNFFRKKKN